MQKLTNGMRRDELPIDQPQGTWRDAQNIIVTKSFGSPSNEDGADDVTPIVHGNYQAYPTTKMVIGSCIMGVDKVLFFGTTLPADSEIGLIDENNNYTTILKDSILNFHQDFPIQATFENKYNNNRVIAWSDRGYNSPRILNIDCIPFKLLANFSIDPNDVNKAKNLLDLFPSFNTPLLEPDNLTVRDGQGILNTGVYYPIIAYELSDGTVTSWSKVYNGVPIYIDNQSLKFEQVGGDLGGLPTNKSISITFTNVDVNYKYLRYGYIYLENGQPSGHYASKKIITGTSLDIEIFGNEITLTTIDLSEILVPNATYNGAQSITNLQGRLLLGGVTTQQDIDYQIYANQIEVTWIREKDISVHSIVKNITSNGSIVTYGSYKDGSLVVFDKSFKSGECYALYIAAKLKKGGVYSRAFHIPGRVPNSTDKDLIIANNLLTNVGDAQDLDSGHDIPRYEILDTSTLLSANEGTMGFWENEDEEYPLDSTGLTVHADYINIPGVTVNNRKVRHHVFPDLKALKGYGKDFLKIANSGGITKAMTMQNNTLGSPSFEYYVSYYNDILTNTGNNSAFNFSASTNQNTFDNFIQPGVLTINNTFFQTNGGLPYFLTTPCITSAGNIIFHWDILKNGVPIKNFSINITAGVSPSVYLDPDTGTYPGSISFAQIANLQIPVIPGDQIIIQYQISMPGSGGITNTNPAIIAQFLANYGSLLAVTYHSNNPSSQPLGLKFNNIKIPASIIDQIDSMEIFYAKRTSNNIRIIGQDMVKEARFHSFDLMNNKISNANYLKPNLFYTPNTGAAQLQDSVTTIGGTSEMPFATDTIKFIQKFLYIGSNTLFNLGTYSIDNTNKADSIYIEAGHGVTVTNAQTVLASDQIANNLFDICIFRRNTYLPFQSQELVSTGYSFKVDTSNYNNIDNTYSQQTNGFKVYGGDIYINGFGFKDGTGAGSTNSVPFYLACESVSNIGLRYQDVPNSLLYYPKSGNPTLSFYGYNKDYNSINDFNQLDIFYLSGDCQTNPINNFPYRIPYSIVDANESKILNWRTFKANSYYEMPKSKGIIWNILGGNRELYIHHTGTLYVAEIRDKLNTQGAETFLGTSDIFDRPPTEILPTNEGYVGNQSQFATLLCELGYCCIDRKMGRVFIYNLGQPIEEISNRGMYNFFKEHSESVNPSTDNPFTGHGYTMAYDSSNKRLIISKLEVPVFGQLAGFPFTISYSPYVGSNGKAGGWVAFHSYKPNLIFFNRSGLYGVDNTHKKLFRHNSKTSKATFYSGTPDPSYVDVVINEGSGFTKRFDNATWLSVTDLNGTIFNNETISHLAIIGNSKCSGLINLTKDNGLWFGKDRRNTEETWNFNDFRDIVKNTSNPILDSFNQIINSNLNNNMAWFEQSKFITKFVILRLWHDNLNQKNISIVAVGSNLIKSDR